MVAWVVFNLVTRAARVFASGCGGDGGAGKQVNNQAIGPNNEQ